MTKKILTFTMFVAFLLSTGTAMASQLDLPIPIPYPPTQAA
jgi:hypothetical protein